MRFSAQIICAYLRPWGTGLTEEGRLLTCLFPQPSKTQQYDCKWYVPLTDLSFQTLDESEVTPNIPLVLDEEIDAMKIKISQIKNDIQREKVGLARWDPCTRAGGWACWGRDLPLISEICCQQLYIDGLGK